MRWIMRRPRRGTFHDRVWDLINEALAEARAEAGGAS